MFKNGPITVSNYVVTQFLYLLLNLTDLYSTKLADLTIGYAKQSQTFSVVILSMLNLRI